MKTRNEKKKFTLIELLVVIGIIALLAALLFPAIGAVRQHAKKVKAQAQVTALKTAILQYETQYGLLPIPEASPELNYGTDIDEDKPLSDDAYDALIELLSCVDIDGPGDGTDDEFNARKTRFLTGLSATVDPSYSSAEKQQQRTLTDPYRISGKKYGSRLVVFMDLDGDNQVKIDGTPKYNGKIFIYSLGADGNDDKGKKQGTDNDDVPSWE